MEENRRKKPRLPEPPGVLQKLKLLIVVVNRNRADFYTDFLQSFEVNLQLKMNARGTANSELLHYLGLEESEKRVLFALIREDQAAPALQALDEKFRTPRGGKGIAYTVPLSGVAGVAIYQFLSNNRRMAKEKK